MKNLIRFFSLFCLIVAFGCADKTGSLDMSFSAEAPMVSEAESKIDDPIERKLIKEGHISFEVTNINTTREAILQAVKKYQGYISSDQEFSSSGRKNNRLVIRVPASKFDDLLSDVTHGVKIFDDKDIYVRDITEEFLDIKSRIKTKKELEQRYTELLKQAKNVNEILEIEKQLGKLREEIESVEGRLNYLQDRVSYSTLTITFYESIPTTTEFGKEFKQGLRNGWDNLVWFLIALVNIWTFILIGIGIIVAIRYYKKKRKRNQSISQ